MIEKQKVTVKEMSKAVVEAKSVKYVPAKHIHAAHIQLTFEFERGELLSNLTLLEDHAQEFQCPYCMEKHLSKVIGYAEEIAEGREGDEKIMEALADEMRTARSEIVKFKGKETPDSKYQPYVETFRKWRRKLQGVAEHSHESANIPVGNKHESVVAANK
jgi:hypothetical protein